LFTAGVTDKKMHPESSNAVTGMDFTFAEKFPESMDLMAAVGADCVLSPWNHGCL
jgi:hypothetical protein